MELIIENLHYGVLVGMISSCKAKNINNWVGFTFGMLQQIQGF